MSEQKMNPEVKARWVAALRSGEYKQCDGVLKQNGRHCCLGVLTDLYARERGLAYWKRSQLSELQEGGDAFENDPGIPGPEVVIWSGLDMRRKVRIGGVKWPLFEHNDNGCSFTEIADAIEAQL